jgi:hypothetical protein
MFLAVKNCPDKAVCAEHIVMANQPVLVLPLFWKFSGNLFSQALHSLPVVMLIKPFGVNSVLTVKICGD